MTTSARYAPLDQLFIDGQWVTGADPQHATVNTDPYTGASLATIQHASEAQLDAALHSAARAQKAWALTPPPVRTSLLLRVAALIDTRREELLDWLVRESAVARVARCGRRTGGPRTV